MRVRTHTHTHTHTNNTSIEKRYVYASHLLRAKKTTVKDASTYIENGYNVGYELVVTIGK